MKKMIFLLALIFLISIPIANSAVVEITIEYAPGPSLSVQIIDYPSSAAPSSSIKLTSKVTNVGTDNATNVWLAWSLPSDWTITSGSKNVSFSMLKPNEFGWNNITVTVGATTGTYTITAEANCSEGVGSSDQKSITIAIGEGEAEAEAEAEGEGPVCKPRSVSCVATEECCSPYICVDGVCDILIALTYIVDSGIELYQNESVESILKITNAGTVDLTDVRISFLDLLKEWYSYTPDYIDKIVPGQTRSFIITYKPLEPGTYDFKINITSKETYQTVDASLVVKELKPGEEPPKPPPPELVEEVRKKISIILPLLVIFGMIGPAIIAIYMLGFMLVKRCPLCGGKMKISYKGKYIISYSCTKCKHVMMEEKR